MIPSLWGPSMWKSIHYIALAYPNNPTLKDKQHYKDFFLKLNNVIPCYRCSVNYETNIKTLPIDNYLDNNVDLFRWTFMIHNMVNKETSKKEISFEHAIDLYVKENNDEFLPRSFIYLLLVFVSIITTYYLTKKKYI